MSEEDRARWDNKYAAKALQAVLVPDVWLVEQVASLPCGRALELACGLGHNAIWLAQQGWRVDAVDVSRVGLQLASQLAQREHASVDWVAADLNDFEPEQSAYDLVLVFRFIDRVRLPQIVVESLRPAGRLIYETFTLKHLSRPDSHLKNPAFALSPGELPWLFPKLTVLSHVECELPDRSVARLVAMK